MIIYEFLIGYISSECYIKIVYQYNPCSKKPPPNKLNHYTRLRLVSEWQVWDIVMECLLWVFWRNIIMI